MTQATLKLINSLCEIIDKNKYLLLSGNTAVGKSYLALEIADHCKDAVYSEQGISQEGYNVEVEFISIHPAYDYEDFVYGISYDIVDNKLVFNYQDKVFLRLVKKANRSWEAKDNKKYFLILDDIGRGPISEILGDVLSAIEPHADSRYQTWSISEQKIIMTPNIYILATESTTTNNIETKNYSLFRHFYHVHIDNDYAYMSDSASPVFSAYEISANAMYNRAKCIVEEHIRDHAENGPHAYKRFVLGHGMFKEKAITLAVKYQVLPILRQYIVDGILDSSARKSIEALSKITAAEYSKDSVYATPKRISGFRKDISPESYYEDETTHKPIVNLIERIISQGLMSETDVIDSLLFSEGILIRKGSRIDGVQQTYPTPGYLYVKQDERDTYIYGTTRTKDNRPKKPRYFYSSTDTLVIDGVKYCAAQEMQPKEYTRWSDELNSDTYVNERASSSPNSIMFRILRMYYLILDRKYTAYLSLFPNDENIRFLQAFTRYEFEEFISFVKTIGSGSDEADVNLERNRMFRERISKLTLLWNELGSTFSWNNQVIRIEGVYNVRTSTSYHEYLNAMDLLGIHQLVFQGPPGTSKTHSAREFIKYVSAQITHTQPLTDEELDSLQVKSYENWNNEHHKTRPAIAWDIVQFHPSYGYEDFVRGIEVSTQQTTSSIAYNTVNKVLGKMAALASRPENRDVRFYLLIDEINRANLATVFGELIYGLEYRGRKIATPYTVDNSNKVMLPENLYIIGTMNTADKSIGSIDYAIRRRFLFFSLLPDKKIIQEFNLENLSGEQHQEQIDVNNYACKLFDSVASLFSESNLNSEYYKDDIQIGHTYFLVTSKEQLYLRFKYQILPILREYYKDGIFQFDVNLAENDAYLGLEKCILGEININNGEMQVKEVFDKLLGL